MIVGIHLNPFDSFAGQATLVMFGRSCLRSPRTFSYRFVDSGHLGLAFGDLGFESAAPGLGIGCPISAWGILGHCLVPFANSYY